jgi:hypothetical protein
MRPTIVEVFPVPAEAIMRFCFSFEVAAVYCSLFNRDNGK